MMGIKRLMTNAILHPCVKAKTMPPKVMLKDDKREFRLSAIPDCAFCVRIYISLQTSSGLFLSYQANSWLSNDL